MRQRSPIATLIQRLAPSARALLWGAVIAGTIGTSACDRLSKSKLGFNPEPVSGGEKTALSSSSQFVGIESISLTAEGKYVLAWSASDNVATVYDIYSEQIDGVSTSLAAIAVEPALGKTLTGVQLAIEPEAATPRVRGLQLASVTGGNVYQLSTSPDRGHTYRFQVRARYADGSQDGNNWVLTVPFDATDFSPFAGLESATVVSHSKILLKWTAAPSSTTRYLIYNAADLNTAIATTTQAEYTVTGLQTSTLYTFVVRAVDEAGYTDSNTVEKSATTLSQAVPDFAGLTLAATASGTDGLTRINLSWTSGDSAVYGYRVFMAQSSGAENFSSPVAVLNAVTSNATIGAYVPYGATSATVTGLTAGTTYYFVVRAFYYTSGVIASDTNTIERSAATLSLTSSLPNPDITSVSPTFGPSAGGTTLTLTGTGFIAGATVTVGGTVCGSVNVASSTSLTCVTGTPSVVPAATAAQSVIITNVVGSPDTADTTFHYTDLSPPVLNAISVAAGAINGATVITLTGSNFVGPASVTFGGTAATSVTVNSASSITATTPAHSAATVNVTVINGDTQTSTLSSAYTYQPAPTVTAISPTIGSSNGGTAVTITGANFTANSVVTLGGSVCFVTGVTGTTLLQCTTAARADGVVSVVVTNEDTQTGTKASAYTYTSTPGPTITTVSPAIGSTGGNTTVTLTGTGYNASSTVRIGGSTCTVTSQTSTQLVCTTGARSPGLVDVLVTNPDTQSSTKSSAYTYTTSPAPTVTAITPSIGYIGGGKLVTITGTGFTTGASVTLGTAACTPVTVVSYTSITCTTGIAAMAATVAVTVTNADTQFGSLAAAFVYSSQPPPTVTSLSPSTGAAAGNTLVVLTGTGFVSTPSLPTILIGSVPCTSVTFSSSTSMSCRTGAATSGTYDVTVTNADTQYGSRTSGFTVLGAVSLSSISPTTSPLAGGSTITLNGSGFGSPLTVTMGGLTCTNPTWVSSTEATCVSPPNSAGSYTVVLTNPDGNTAQLSNGITYQGAPLITTVAPTMVSINGGSVITVSGSGMIAGATIYVGSTGNWTACQNQAWVSSTQMTCTTPVHAAGSVDVKVVNADTQSYTKSSALLYGTVYTRMDFLAGHLSPQGNMDGVGAAARIRGVGQFARAGTSDYMYFTDPGSRTIKRFRISTKAVTTIAGNPAVAAACASGTGSGATFNKPYGLAIDSTETYLYISDMGCGMLMKMSLADYSVTILRTAIWTDALVMGASDTWLYGAGRAQPYCCSNATNYIQKINPGTGTDTQLNAFSDAYSLTSDGTTYLYASNGGSNKIRRIAIADGTSLEYTAPGNVHGLWYAGGYVYYANAAGSTIYKWDPVAWTAPTAVLANANTYSYPNSFFKNGTVGSAGYQGDVCATNIYHDGTWLYYAGDSVGQCGNVSVSSDLVNNIVARYRASDFTLEAMIGPQVGLTNRRTEFAAGFGSAGQIGNVHQSYSADMSYTANDGPGSQDNHIRVLQGPTDSYPMIYGGNGTPGSAGTGNVFKVDPVSGELSSVVTAGAGYRVGTPTLVGNELYAPHAHAILKYNLSTGFSTASYIGNAGNGANAIDASTLSTVRYNFPSDALAIYNTSLGQTELFVVDKTNYCIKKTNLTTNATTYVAGGTGGTTGTADGTSAASRFTKIDSMWYDGSRYLYVTDNHAIRRIDLSSSSPSTDTSFVTTWAGTIGSSGYQDGLGLSAKFYQPRGITGDGTYVYVADMGNSAIRRIQISTGTVTTFAGRGASASYAGIVDMDQPGLLGVATIRYPVGVAYDSVSKKIFVSNQSGIYVIQ